MPDLFIIGGPNGAGKTTIALRLLPSLACYEYVNADAIAAALSPFKPESVALQAGRIMLERLHAVAITGADFAFETTMAARPLPLVQQCQDEGYTVNVLYIWLQSVELAIQRVAVRVRSGGHSIPEETIRRRYATGRKNFVSLYMPLADSWWVYDNSNEAPFPIAEGNLTENVIHHREHWHNITSFAQN